MSARREPIRLTRSTVCHEALGLVDAEGLEALTMRRLAARLGCEAMSLYHHVRDKADLLDALHAAVLGDLEPGHGARGGRRPPPRSRRVPRGRLLRCRHRPRRLRDRHVHHRPRHFRKERAQRRHLRVRPRSAPRRHRRRSPQIPETLMSPPRTPDATTDTTAPNHTNTNDTNTNDTNTNDTNTNDTNTNDTAATDAHPATAT